MFRYSAVWLLMFAMLYFVVSFIMSTKPLFTLADHSFYFCFHEVFPREVNFKSSSVILSMIGFIMSVVYGHRGSHMGMLAGQNLDSLNMPLTGLPSHLRQ